MNSNQFQYFVSVKFKNASRPYYFGTNDETLKLNDKVVVETVRGKEIGTLCSELKDIELYTSQLDLSPIIRKATDTDLSWEAQNIKDAAFAYDIFNEESKKLGLDMRLLYAEYTLDKAKIIFSYLADERIDFRELLKVLAAKLRTRIELRQIGSRDKAKMIGGIGVCGLPICCSTFLNEFDGVSINRAKNQMLAINIPKLSGHCGKLICCLKYEDDTYTELKKEFPPIGEHVNIDNEEYKVASYNAISKRITLLSNEQDYKVITLEEYKKIKNPEPRPNKFFNKNNNKKRFYDKKK